MTIYKEKFVESGKKVSIYHFDLEDKVISVTKGWIGLRPKRQFDDMIKNHYYHYKHWDLLQYKVKDVGTTFLKEAITPRLNPEKQITPQ
jgi:hypothetical protein